MLFDTHAHVLSTDRERYPYGSLRGGAVPPVPAVEHPVDALLSQMDRLGVASACLVQRATLYGYDNSYALDAAGTCPGRLFPVVVLDAQDPASPVALADMVENRGAAGLRLVAPTLTRDETDWLAGEQARLLWAAAEALRLPVAVILYRLNNDAGRAALLEIARRFTEVPIVLDHVGLPHASTPEKTWAQGQGLDYALPTDDDFGIERLLAPFGELPHVHFKVTDINFDRLEENGLDAGAFLQRLADRFGAERLVWGSDVGQSPAPYEKKVRRLKSAASALGERQRAAFMHGTAAVLYRPHAMANP